MIKQLFIDLQHNKDYFLKNTKSWNDFENIIEKYLIEKAWLKKITEKNITNLVELKELVKDKVAEDKFLLDNYLWEDLDGCFISQPFWTQSYPDFILFQKDKIIVLEIKFTANNNNPMWNSWFPRNTWIYIYGNKSKNDITFFWGWDVLTNDERTIMLDFFEGLKQQEVELNKKLLEHDINHTGFQVYIRKAFIQKNTQEDTETTFLWNSKRKNREENVLKLFNKNNNMNIK